MDVKVTFADIDEETSGIAGTFQDVWDSIELNTGCDDLDRTWCDWIIAKCKQELEERATTEL